MLPPRLTFYTLCNSFWERVCVRRQRDKWWSRRGEWSLYAGMLFGPSSEAFYSLHRSPGIKKEVEDVGYDFVHRQ